MEKRRPPIAEHRTTSKSRHADGFLTGVSHIAMDGKPCPMINAPFTSVDVLENHILSCYTAVNDASLTMAKAYSTWLEQRTMVSRLHFDIDAFIRSGTTYSDKDYSAFLIKVTKTLQSAVRLCFTAEGSEFVPPDGVLVSRDERVNLGAIVATANPKTIKVDGSQDSNAPKDQEWKAHIYFDIAMTSHQMRIVRALSIELLAEAFKGTAFHSVDWPTTVDDKVYCTNGLRMLYCDKARRCVCRGDKGTRRPTPGCEHCGGEGFTYANRIYRVAFVLGPEGKLCRKAAASLQADNRTGRLAALKATRIRMPNPIITPGFRTPLGTPSVMPYKYVQSARLCGHYHYKILNRPTLIHLANKSDWRYAFLKRAVRAYPVTHKTKSPLRPYSAIDHIEIYVQNDGRYLRVDIIGKNDSFCCNMRRQHNRCGRAFFLVRRHTKTGQIGITQHCICPKPVRGFHGVTCKEYSKRTFKGEKESVIEKDAAAILASVPMGKNLFQAPGSSTGEVVPMSLGEVVVDPAFLSSIAGTRPVSKPGLVAPRSVSSAGTGSTKRRLRNVSEGVGQCFTGDRSVGSGAEHRTVTSHSTDSSRKKRRRIVDLTKTVQKTEAAFKDVRDMASLVATLENQARTIAKAIDAGEGPEDEAEASVKESKRQVSFKEEGHPDMGAFIRVERPKKPRE